MCTGIPCTIRQYAILSMPVFAWQINTETTDRRFRGVIVTLLAGCLVVPVAYGSVFFFSGRRAFAASLQHSVFVLGQNIRGGEGLPTWYGEPVRWAGLTLLGLSRQEFRYIASTFATMIVNLGRRELPPFLMSAVVLTDVMFIPFLVRNYLYYWVNPLPYVAVLA